MAGHIIVLFVVPPCIVPIDPSAVLHMLTYFSRSAYSDSSHCQGSL